MTDVTAGIEVRQATAADDRQVLDLLAGSLGWLPDGLHSDFFRWKHRENPFGPSDAWVALDDGRVVGYRTFLRWRFLVGGRPVDAVRAVDTATDPACRGRGVFRTLTLHGVEVLRSAGVGFVFNTPNAQSAPGYLKMGWRPVGRVPVSVAVRSPRGLARAARSRTAADLWSLPTTAGRRASEALSDVHAVESVLAEQPPVGGVTTERTAAYLRWRYGFEPLNYRIVAPDGDPAGGFAVFRLRRRGHAVEAVVCELLVRGRERSGARRLLRDIRRQAGADHLLLVGTARHGAALPLPRAGPLLTWRALADGAMPPLRAWKLSGGDVELF